MNSCVCFPRTKRAPIVRTQGTPLYYESPMLDPFTSAPTTSQRAPTRVGATATFSLAPAALLACSSGGGAAQGGSGGGGSGGATPGGPSETAFMLGADISSVPEQIDQGAVYFDT